MPPARLERLPAHALTETLTVSEALGWRARLLGLALLDDVPLDQALLIRRCRSVHTFGMRFPIDIVFLDRGGAVVRLVTAALPQRAFTASTALAVLETSAGRAERFLSAGAGGLVGTSDRSTAISYRVARGKR